jgi:hypothetical protein
MAHAGRAYTLAQNRSKSAEPANITAQACAFRIATKFQEYDFLLKIEMLGRRARNSFGVEHVKL